MCLCRAPLFPRLLWFLRERRFARRENGGCRGRGDTQGGTAPGRSCQGPTRDAVDRDLAGTGDGQGDSGSDDQEIELVTAARVEEPIAPVDGGDRDEHHAADCSCTQGSDQSENETHAAAELGEPRD